MIGAALAAVEQIFTAPFRAVMGKTIGLTLLLLAILGVAVEHLIVAYVHVPQAWLQTGLHVILGIVIVACAIFLIPATSFVVASLFFDELADHVEATIAGPTGRGRRLPMGPALWIGAKFSLLSLCVFALAWLLLLVPGVNLIAFFAANAYLFGRGLFEFAALRHVDVAAMRDLRQRHAIRIFLAGGVITAFATIPLVNLLTPLFAAAFMVRITQPLLRERVVQRVV